MKKILIAIITIFLLGIGTVSAQNANRSGFLVSASVGYTEGREDDSWNMYDNSAALIFGFGYRWATSLHWGLELTTNIGYSGLFESAYVDFLFGPRWTSNDFWGNKSLYVGAAVGLGYPSSYFYDYYDDIYSEYWGFVSRLDIGLNLGLKSSFGLYTNYTARASNAIIVGACYRYRF
ncbi:MAG: hypothetical protein NC098_08535 [Lachnoclostridium sp.]|nr:hypothetical protein [Lachnoclostridium sp.]